MPPVINNYPMNLAQYKDFYYGNRAFGLDPLHGIWGNLQSNRINNGLLGTYKTTYTNPLDSFDVPDLSFLDKNQDKLNRKLMFQNSKFGQALSGVTPETLGGITAGVTGAAQVVGDAVQSGKGTFTEDTKNNFVSDQQGDLANFNNAAFSADNTSDIIGLAGMMPGFTNSANNIETQQYSFGKTLGSVGKGAAAGAALGSVIPGLGNIVGAIGGGIFGLVSDLTGQGVGIFGDKKRKEQAIAQAQALDEQAASTLNYGTQRVSNLNYKRGMANYLNNAAMGGPLFTHGSDFSDDLTRVDAGGSHESNPLGGVPAGVDPQGVPNLVEEGETIWDNGDEEYVFSKRLKAPKSLVKEFKLGGGKKGLSYSEAARRISEKSGATLRPNDPISRRTKDDQLAQLEESQEQKRADIKKRELLNALSQMSPEELQGMFAPQQGMPMQASMPPQGGMEEPLMQEPIQGDGMYEPVGIQGFAFGGPAHILSGKKGESKKVTRRQQAFRNAYRSGAIHEYSPGYWSGSVPGLGYKGYGEAVAGMTTQQLLRVMGDPTLEEEVSSGMNTALGRYKEPDTPTRDTTRITRQILPSGVATTSYVSQAIGNPQTYPQTGSNKERTHRRFVSRYEEPPVDQPTTQVQAQASSQPQPQPQITTEAYVPRANQESVQGIDKYATRGSGSGSSSARRRIGTTNVEGPWSDQWGKYALPGVQRYFNNLIEQYNNAGSDAEKQAIRRQAIDTVNKIQSGYRDIYNQFNENGVTYSDAVRAHQQAFSDVGGNYGFNGIDDDLIYGYTGRTNDNAKGSFAPDGLYGWRTALRNFGSTASGDTPKVIAELADKLDLDWTPTMDYGKSGNKLYTLSERQRGTAPNPAGVDAGLTGVTPETPADRETKNTIKKLAEKGANPQTEQVARRQLDMLPTWMRYAPIVGSGLSVIGSVFDNPDYSDYEGLVGAARRLGRPVAIPVETIGNRLRRNPFDERLAVNQANNNFLAGVRGTMDTAGGNRAYRQFANNLLAYNNQGALSDIAGKSYLANRQDALQTADFNRGTDMYNANAINQRNLAQAQLNSNREQAGFNALLGATQALDNARRYDEQFVDADLTGLLEGLGRLGKENASINMIRSLANEGALDYAIGRNGEVSFIPGSGYRVTKNGGKIKTKKRRF